MGTMSQIFQDRVFEEHVAFSRADRRRNVRNEMDMPAFLDFLLAWENRETPQAASYFFKVLDIRGQGYLTQVGGGRLLTVCAGPARGPGRAGSHPRQLSCGLEGLQAGPRGAGRRSAMALARPGCQGAEHQGYLTEVRGMCSVSKVLTCDVCVCICHGVCFGKTSASLPSSALISCFPSTTCRSRSTSSSRLSIECGWPVASTVSWTPWTSKTSCLTW